MGQVGQVGHGISTALALTLHIDNACVYHRNKFYTHQKAPKEYKREKKVFNPSLLRRFFYFSSLYRPSSLGLSDLVFIIT